MDYTLNEEQQMIRDAAAEFLSGRCDSAALRSVLEQPANNAHDAALWHEMGESLGWCALTVPDHCGGMAMGQVERVLLMEQMGRRLPAVPYFASACLAADALQFGAAGPGDRLLARLASGEAIAALALPQLARWDAEAVTVTARRHAHGYALDGVVAQVMGGAQADMLLVPAILDGGAAVGADARVEAGIGAGGKVSSKSGSKFGNESGNASGNEPDGTARAEVVLLAVPSGAPGVSVTPLRTLDATRAIAGLRLNNVQVGADAWLGAGAALQDGLRRTTALAALALAAEQVGGARRCLELTLDYVGERVQFGRAIASFQAIKHRCAQMMVALESAASMVQGAARQADAGAEGWETAQLETDIACAKLAANHALFYCAQEAIQLHGGVGFTWEYDPHLYFKRAQAARVWFGDDSACLRQIAQALADGVTHTGAAAKQNEFEQWLEAQLSGDFAALRHRGGPGDEDAYPEERKAWERALAAAGWTCAGWPTEYGGRGMSLAEQVAHHEQYAKAGGPGRVGHIGEGLIGPTLIALGTEDQQRRHLPGIRNGTTLWCQGYSEPNAGSDLANVQTRAVRDEASGDWIVSGQKVWTSLAHESQWIFVLARCEPGSRGSRGLIFLLMPLDQPGVEIRPIRQISGSAEFNEVFFDGARARACDVVGKPGEGWQVAMALLGFERGLSTLGQQMHFLHELGLVIAAARDNGNWHDRSVRDRIARAWAGLRAMRCNALRMLSSADKGQLAPESLIYKYHWSNWHRDLGELAMDVLGVDANVLEEGDGDINGGRRSRLQSLFLFSRSDTIYAGANEIQLNIIAERGLGMPKEARGDK